jgi:hypothetical protein
MHMTIADALPRCFPLPTPIRVGNQEWTFSRSAVVNEPGGAVLIALLLSGPYARFRHVRVRLQTGALLEGRYDSQRLVELVSAWLPHSDAQDVLLVTGDSLLPIAHFTQPAHD